MTTKLPNLDGLRALAIALVALYHCNLLAIGWVGVQLFFVLSGFLITRSLLELRDETLGQGLKTFYLRRVQRIFPLYFLFLALVLLASSFGLPDVETAKRSLAAWPDALVFAINWRPLLELPAPGPLLGHFWSLAIEEQFYLLWPWLLLTLPARALAPAMTALVLLGPAARALQLHLWPDLNTAALGVAQSTLSHLDAFALGGLTCLLRPEGLRLPHTGARLALAALLVMALGMAMNGWGFFPARTLGAPLTLGWPNTLPQGMQAVWGYSALNLLFALLIVTAAGGWGTRVWQQAGIAYIGKLSYGLYVWHYPLAHLMSPLVFRLHDLTGAGFYTCLLLWLPLYLGLLIGLAALSYEGYERFFLRNRQERG